MAEIGDTGLNAKVLQLQSDPDNVEDVAKAHLLLGVEAERCMDWEAAADHYQRLIELAPKDKGVRYFGYNNRAYALLQLRRFAEAELHCVAAIEVDDDRHNAYKNIGLAYQALEQPATAAVCFIKAGFRNPADKRAWLHLQQLLSRTPDLLDDDPETVEAMEQLRKHYEVNGGVPGLN